MKKFSEIVIEIVKQIPPGKVASYGQVALMSGAPRAARQVGWILNKNNDPETPWWRVINRSGKITIKNSDYSAYEQKALLEAEGIIVSDNFEVDIEKYRYRAAQ